MVQVIYKSQPRHIRMLTVIQSQHSAIETTDFTIKKKYRYNPLFNGDTPYALRDYFREAISDPRNKDPQVIENARIKAVHTALHRQTNYEYLAKNGLYQLTKNEFDKVLGDWYTMIARRFPEFRKACEYELVRHHRNWQTTQLTA